MITTRAENRAQRYRETRRVTVLGGILDLVLGVLKLVAGYAAGSQALIADGVHSLSDLATDILVVWAAREASRDPDQNHPYGHQRIETLATIILGVALAAVALLIARDAVVSMIEDSALPVPGLAAVLVAGLSIFSKEAIYRYTMYVAERFDSELLRSNAWHSRSDALSSVVVIAGVTGSMAGYAYLDAAAAVVVAAMILWVSGRMIWGGARELIDTGVNPDRLRDIERTVNGAPGVRDVHELRTRRMGNEIYLDGHVLVDPHISVSEGHRVGEAVRQHLRDAFGDITDVTIHIDAEDDEQYQLSAHLPLREEIDTLLEEYWAQIPEASRVQSRTYHYLGGKLYIEVHLPLETISGRDDAADLAARLRHAVAGDPRIAEV